MEASGPSGTNTRVHLQVSDILRENNASPGGEAFFIYSSFKGKGVDQVKKYLQDERYNIGVITGDLNAKKRSQLVAAYNAGELQGLVVTDAGGIGLDVTRVRCLVRFFCTLVFLCSTVACAHPRHLLYLSS